MRIQPINQRQTSFSARSVQVRDAQWVTHIINSELSHFSTTRFIPIFANYMEKFSTLLNIDKRPKSIYEIQKILLKLPIIINNHKNRLKNNSDLPKQEDLNRLYAIKRTTNRVSDARLICKDYVDLTYLNDAFGYLYQIKELRSGNCFENAVLAELILKLNGIEKE